MIFCFQDYENEAWKSGVDVLLTGYMRSGSSAVGRILGFRNDSFYMYEPFWSVNKWEYLAGSYDDMLCGVSFPICRWVYVCTCFELVVTWQINDIGLNKNSIDVRIM